MLSRLHLSSSSCTIFLATRILENNLQVIGKDNGRESKQLSKNSMVDMIIQYIFELISVIEIAFGWSS